MPITDVYYILASKGNIKKFHLLIKIWQKITQLDATELLKGERPTLIGGKPVSLQSTII